MKTITVGGVPEHFNLPWHLAIEEKLFESENINLVWKDFPGGTGAMNKALRSGEIDIAIILTEGVIKDISEGNPSKIVQTYVDSPLIWGIHTAGKSSYETIEDLEGKTAAISRIGSGSQLMAKVNAKNHHWETDNLKFEIVGNLQGGIDALTEGRADYFMWEHFTTKPLVDNGTFNRVGDCPTPWPCFVIAVRDEILDSNEEEIVKILRIINSKTKNFDTFENKQKYSKMFSERYEQKEEDILKWLKLTKWNQGEKLNKKEFEEIISQLIEYNVIDKELKFSEFTNLLYL
ncbi:substrate-binding domain-containing protein [Aureivirga sp. CE67]|uniref:substrate-binding domain-containing protein n=1 Tax=Aureivirga sp. CE67 TaxID=1788983 RepID=UPI0018CA0B06|nr:substrate-binding domain-containing protein [Aureivirga sp. CE67]